MALANVPPDDADFWTYWPKDLPRPANDPLDDPVFSAELTLEIAYRILAERVARLDRVRDICARAHSALDEAMAEVREACAIVSDGAYEVARRRGEIT